MTSLINLENKETNQQGELDCCRCSDNVTQLDMTI